MDPHPHTHVHVHNHKQLNHSIGWGKSSPSLQNMLASSMEDHHHRHSHISFHDHPHHYHLPSLDHQHHSLAWQQSSSSDHYSNYDSILPLSQSHQIFSSPSSSASLFFVGSSTPQHHQLALPDHHHHEHHQYTNNHMPEEEVNIYQQRGDLVAAGNKEEEDHDDEVDEDMSAMKEMMYKIAAMQPVNIDPSTIRKPKRRNVRISDDPQSVAARHRRERISEKMRILQRLVPGGTKMDTASMLDEAIRYVKFLKRQIRRLQQDNHPQQLPPVLIPAPTSSKACHNTSADHHHHPLTVTTNNKQQQYTRLFSAESTTGANNTSISAGTGLLHHDDLRADDISLDLLNNSGVSNNKVQTMENNSIIRTPHQQQMDVFNQVS